MRPCPSTVLGCRSEFSSHFSLSILIGEFSSVGPRLEWKTDETKTDIKICCACVIAQCLAKHECGTCKHTICFQQRTHTKYWTTLKFAIDTTEFLLRWFARLAIYLLTKTLFFHSAAVPHTGFLLLCFFLVVLFLSFLAFVYISRFCYVQYTSGALLVCARAATATVKRRMSLCVSVCVGARFVCCSHIYKYIDGSAYGEHWRLPPHTYIGTAAAVCEREPSIRRVCVSERIRCVYMVWSAAACACACASAACREMSRKKLNEKNTTERAIRECYYG